MSERSNGVATWTIILTAVSIVVGICHNNQSTEIEEARLRQEFRKDSLIFAEKEEKKIQEYEALLERFDEENARALRFHSDKLAPFEVRTNSKRKLCFCLSYLSLNNKWTVKGYYSIEQGHPISFSDITNNFIVYIAFTNLFKEERFAKINSLPLTELLTISKKTREGEAFTIVADHKPPFNTILRNFYKVNFTETNAIDIHVID